MGHGRSDLLSPAEAREALEKGFGRILLQCVRTGQSPDDQLIIEASSVCLAYDKAVEGTRSAWMLEILAACDSVKRLRDPILDALAANGPTDDWTQADHICEMLEAYARLGDVRARSLLLGWLDAPDAAPYAYEPLLRLEGAAMVERCVVGSGNSDLPVPETMTP